MVKWCAWWYNGVHGVKVVCTVSNSPSPRPKNPWTVSDTIEYLRVGMDNSFRDLADEISWMKLVEIAADRL